MLKPWWLVLVACVKSCEVMFGCARNCSSSTSTSAATMSLACAQRARGLCGGLQASFPPGRGSDRPFSDGVYRSDRVTRDAPVAFFLKELAPHRAGRERSVWLTTVWEGWIAMGGEGGARKSPPER